MKELILDILGLKVVYEYAGKTYSRRYDSVDYQSMRPFHRDMSVAPPWAKSKIVRKKR